MPASARKKNRVEVNPTCKRTIIVRSGSAMIFKEPARPEVTSIAGGLLDVVTESIKMSEASLTGRLSALPLFLADFATVQLRVA